ncbi:hypothetical protein, partial [Staphylococcus aureus]|uniref:hypothetical protein n=1 Tax=Staphylococcus aureus TaxID=1280 RepID=UPI001CDA051C
SSSCLLSRRFNHTTGFFLCQKFLSTRKIAIIPYIPRITAIILKSSYFYIVSRQEETRFQLGFKNLSKTINPQKYHANDTPKYKTTIKKYLE